MHANHAIRRSGCVAASSSSREQGLAMAVAHTLVRRTSGVQRLQQQRHYRRFRPAAAPADGAGAAAPSAAPPSAPPPSAAPPTPPPPGARVTASTITDLQALLGSLTDEYAYWIDPGCVEGAIPADLVGTYYRNGPGLSFRTRDYERHAFDGDGMVVSLSFRGGRAFFRNKFVRTKGFVDEQVIWDGA
jgi:hypothetical protein